MGLSSRLHGQCGCRSGGAGLRGFQGPQGGPPGAQGPDGPAGGAPTVITLDDPNVFPYVRNPYPSQPPLVAYEWFVNFDPIVAPNMVFDFACMYRMDIQGLPGRIAIYYDSSAPGVLDGTVIFEQITPNSGVVTNFQQEIGPLVKPASGRLVQIGINAGGGQIIDGLVPFPLNFGAFSIQIRGSL